MMPRPGKWLYSAVGLVARKASRNYIAGPAPEDAQRVGRRLVDRGYWITQGYWDGSGDAPEEVLDTYLATLRQLAGLDGNHYLSLKIPALRYSREMFAAVLAASRRSNVPLHFDSLAPEHAERMHAFIRQHSQPESGNIGCTLPGRWRRSIEDADRVSELGLNVRVVKGQWEDPVDPERDARSGYLDVVDRLAGKARCVRIATHDAPLAREALSRLIGAGTRCELELLFGLPVNNLVPLAAELGVPVRIYIAFGHAYLPYALASLRKQPGMLLKLFKAACKQNNLSAFPVCTSSLQPEPVIRKIFEEGMGDDNSRLEARF